MEKEAGRSWAESMGFEDPIIFTPDRECRGSDPQPSIVFVGLEEGMTIKNSPLDVFAVVSASDNFDRYVLQYGVGNNPDSWKTIDKGDEQYRQPKKLAEWDLTDVDASRITLRIYIYSTEDTFAEKRIHLNLQVPKPTPTITPTVDITPTETPVPTETSVPEDTPTPEPSATFTDVPEETDIPVPSDTP